MEDYRLKPDFVEGSRGCLFALDVEPNSKRVATALYIPPHGEELNRCRSVVANQSRVLAQRGVACRVLDLFGTGDSQGEFREGNWTVWQQDIEQQISVLRAAHDAPVILIGFRLGGLGVIDYLDRHQNTVDQAILIQPVLSGKQYVTQLLRQRMAAQITSGVEKETTSQLRERLDSGENLEIGGYEFGCQLLNDLDNLNVTEKQSVSNVHFSWLEYVASETSDLTLPSKKAIAQFEEQSNRVSVKPFVDHQVWQLHEREEAEASIKVFEDLELGF